MPELEDEQERSALASESGAIAVLVALLFGTGFMVLLFVMVFDVSNIYAERRIVQNAADRASLALVKECSEKGTGIIRGESSGYPSQVCENVTYAKGFATSYANLNSPDGKTNVAEVCGTVLSVNCATQPNTVHKCSTVDTTKYKNFVRVRTDSESNTRSFIRPLFLSAIDGNSSVDVKGCTNSAWGKTKYAPIVIPFILPICDYLSFGGREISLFDPNNPTQSCVVTDAENTQWTYNSSLRGFSFFDSGTTNTGASYTFSCPTTTNRNEIELNYRLNRATSISLLINRVNSCSSTSFFAQLDQYITNGDKLFLPAASNVQGGQGTYDFTVVGFFAFKLQGYRFGTSNSYGTPPAGGWSAKCLTNSSYCLNGTFDAGTVPGATIFTDSSPAVGAIAIQLLP